MRPKPLESALPGSRIIKSRSAIFENSNRDKYIKRQIVFNDFPVEYVFQTQEEIDLYFGDDRVQCLLCGRWFKALGHHLLRTHGTATREYKLKYGLPLNKGLSSLDLRKRLRTLRREEYRKGISALGKKENRLKGLIASKNKKTKYVVQPFNKERMSKTHLCSPSILYKREYNPKIIKSILCYAKDKKVSIEEAIDNSSISRSMFYKWKKIFEMDNERNTTTDNNRL